MSTTGMAACAHIKHARDFEGPHIADEGWGNVYLGVKTKFQSSHHCTGSRDDICHKHHKQRLCKIWKTTNIRKWTLLGYNISGTCLLADEILVRLQFNLAYV